MGTLNHTGALVLAALWSAGTVFPQDVVQVPRVISLGRANGAELEHMENFYQNPASLVFSSRRLAMVSYRNAQGRTPNAEVLTLPLIRGGAFGFAMGFTLSNAGKIFPRVNDSFVTYGMDVGGACELVSGLGAGGLVHVSRGTVSGQSATAATATLGLLYSPSPAISYAATLEGVGDVIAARPDSREIVSIAAQRRIQVGVVLRYPSPLSLRRKIFTICLANEHAEDLGLVYRGGIEVFPVGFLALRIGYATGSAVNTLGMGIGIEVGRVHVDYALSRAEGDNSVHMGSVSLEL